MLDHIFQLFRKGSQLSYWSLNNGSLGYHLRMTEYIFPKHEQHHFVISFLLLFLRNTKIPDGILNFNLPCLPICGKTSNSLNFKLILPYWPVFGVGLWILLANSNNQQVLSWLKCYSLTILSESLSICYWARHVVFGWYLMPLSFSFSYIWELLGSVWLLSPDIRDGDSGDKVDMSSYTYYFESTKISSKTVQRFYFMFLSPSLQANMFMSLMYLSLLYQTLTKCNLRYQIFRDKVVTSLAISDNLYFFMVFSGRNENCG